VKVGVLSEQALRRELTGRGIRLRTGPFVFSIRSRIPSLAAGIHLLYGDHPLESADAFADFHVRLRRPHGARYFFGPQVLFEFEGFSSFKPLPLDQAFPMLEWGMNWCISTHAEHYLIIHAAAIERDGRAVIMPAPPGSGKSTLCAGLVSRGWRLLSDELTLIRLEDGALVPIARPISLKNQSIEVMRVFAPELAMSPPVHDTTKGSVAHLRAPIASVERVNTTARPGWVIFPQYQAGSPTVLSPHPRAQAFMELGAQSFNYAKLGKPAFEVLADLVDRSLCFDFRYSSLDEAVEIFDRLPLPPAP